MPEPLSDADRETLIAAWREAHPGQPDEAMPEALRVAAEPADTDTDLPAVSRRFLSKLRDLLKEKVGEEDFKDAVKRARSHAGGKASAAAKSRTASYDDDGVYRERRGDLYLPKIDERVNYRPSPDVPEEGVEPAEYAGVIACGTCRFYKWGSCQIVEGTIEADDVCDLHSPAPLTIIPINVGVTMSEACGADGGSARLLYELPKTFAEASDWIPVLPVPGVYTHPSYGKIVISRDRNQRFADNVNTHVYGQDLPVDAEHNLKASGAMGYITELRLNPNGSADGRVRWNDRGRQALSEERFRYFSPEWLETWTDPLTTQVHKDVLIGGALTTRPFFKDTALRPLIASESGILAAMRAWSADDGVDAMVADPLRREAGEPRQEEPGMGDQPKTFTLTEEQYQQFTEAAAKAAKLDEVEGQLQSYAERVAAMEAENRRQKFTDLVTGKGSANDGRRFFGDPARHVQMLEILAEKFGEDSEPFKLYVTQQQEAATAIQARDQTSNLFAEIGSARSGETSAMARYQAAINDLRQKDPSLSVAKAGDLVLQADPQLYSEIHPQTPRSITGAGY